MPLNVAFLWHMHQPYYVDPVRGVALMPWVRLHATKGYLDMIWLAEQFPEFHCTFNLTPVLIKQLQQLANNTVRDLWYDLAATPAESLTPSQKCALLEHFFKANWDHMIKPFPRYWSLLHKRGINLARIDFARVAASFNAQEFRDLQVWYHLTWFGYAGERLYPAIAALKGKGRDFTEDDKAVLFAHQRDVLQGVLGRYKACADRGQIELSTTPFYHPIMPLVHNTEFARRCMPGRELPPQFSRPEDVRAQLTLSCDLHTQVFGAPPRGVWPSEGSVCPELMPILQDLGFQWFATDEEILWRSLAVVHQGQVQSRRELFQGFHVRFGEAAVCAAFRDRSLSDFIGFTASRNEPQRAAELIVGHLEQIARHSTRDSEPGLCSIILDGENAWETFPDGGQAFLRALYERVTTNRHLTSKTFHEYFTKHPPSAVINTLHTGSWINADFDIWICDPEENRAWQLLGRTRDLLQSKMDSHEISSEQFENALAEIYAAEGSDWFWWYGSDFVTDNALIFDELFRTHLQNVYRIIGLTVPDTLKTQICRTSSVSEIAPATDLITPNIDGRLTSFYEWYGAGVYRAGRSMGAMYRSERLIDAVYFGFDRENVYFRLDLSPKAEVPQDLVVRISFIQPTQKAVIISKFQLGQPHCELQEMDSSTSRLKTVRVTNVRFDRILELELSYTELGWGPQDQVSCFLDVLTNEAEIERHPEVGTIDFNVPDELFEIQNWRV